jgi:hypothetical protein
MRDNETVQRESNGDPELARLAVLWPRLSPGDRATVLALVASLSAN